MLDVEEEVRPQNIWTDTPQWAVSGNNTALHSHSFKFYGGSPATLVGKSYLKQSERNRQDFKKKKQE
jgi:hypothetical protein